MTVSDVGASESALTPQQMTERLGELEGRITELEASQPDDMIALIVFSGDLDKVLASFIIATGAAAVGQEVSMFFTFWGLSVLKKKSTLEGKSVFEKMMAIMSPNNSTELPVS